MRTRPRALGAFVAFSSALLLARCTSSTTSVTSPSANKCQVSATSAISSYSATGGTGTVNVTASRDCTWSVAVDGTWISLGTRSGQGEAALRFSVAPNPTPAPRAGVINVSGERIAVNQAGAPCQYDLDHTQDTIGAAGGPLSVGVTTLTGCSWTASTSVGWIAIRSGDAGNGSATVSLSVSPNGGAARTGIVTIASHHFSVVQSTAGADRPPPNPPQNPPPPPKPTTQFDGRVWNLSGSCPSVTFLAGLTTVTTDASTGYKHGSCGDLRDGRDISISGVTEGILTVRATSIDLKGGHDD